jgi:hypothetical protein
MQRLLLLAVHLLILPEPLTPVPDELHRKGAHRTRRSMRNEGPKRKHAGRMEGEARVQRGPWPDPCLATFNLPFARRDRATLRQGPLVHVVKLAGTCREADYEGHVGWQAGWRVRAGGGCGSGCGGLVAAVARLTALCRLQGRLLGKPFLCT